MRAIVSVTAPSTSLAISRSPTYAIAKALRSQRECEGAAVRVDSHQPVKLCGTVATDSFEPQTSRGRSEREARERPVVRGLCQAVDFALGVYARQGQPSRAGDQPLLFRARRPLRGGRPKRGDNPVVRRPGARMPDLGVALPADEVEATLTALGSLRATHPCFLVCNVDLRDDDAPLEAERIPADVRSDFGARAP